MKTTINIQIDNDDVTVTQQGDEKYYALFGGTFDKFYVYCLGNLRRTLEEIEQERDKFPEHLRDRLVIRQITVHNDADK